ncbi:MAG: GntR family transcriptional regulator, transcriptional repressor for pyruvate dehydrogenase complex [Streptosporangiaceae bacterium]|jgi:hypothetical protein|nr:GntR family transcriptional regulator, transcriptional repressor for pyruvate dehydrogenase complex [Streptosporangiaceae bacterium]
MVGPVGAENRVRFGPAGHPRTGRVSSHPSRVQAAGAVLDEHQGIQPFQHDRVHLLGALNAYAVEQAVERASDEDIAGLRSAAEQAAEIVDVESAAAALKHYFVTLSAISHNPLLAALCRFTTEIQIGLAVELPVVAPRTGGGSRDQCTRRGWTSRRSEIYRTVAASGVPPAEPAASRSANHDPGAPCFRNPERPQLPLGQGRRSSPFWTGRRPGSGGGPPRVLGKPVSTAQP